MATTLSPNMSLPVPVVGSEAGPAYASDINSCLSLLDSHDHTLGSGVQITPSALNINADLTIAGNKLTTVKAITFQQQGTALSSSLLDHLYDVNGDLYFNDGLGNQIPITASGAVAGTPGSIANLVSPASASYISGTSTFQFQSNVNTAGNIDAGSFVMRNISASSFGLTLSPPTLSSNYTLTLPQTPVANDSPILMSTAGVMSTGTPSDYFMPAGVILPFGGTSAPTGWLTCDGSAVSRTTYSRLYTAIGNAFGSGDGATTFNVPDFRGRFLRGTDGAAGRDPDSASRTAMNSGGNTGNNVGSIQSGQFASHDHGGGSHLHGLSVYGGGGGPNNQAALETNGGGSLVVNTQASGGIITANGGNETRPLNAYVNYIIKI